VSKRDDVNEVIGREVATVIRPIGKAPTFDEIDLMLEWVDRAVHCKAMLRCLRSGTVYVEASPRSGEVVFKDVATGKVVWTDFFEVE
jgi:hypothetical protein